MLQKTLISLVWLLLLSVGMPIVTHAQNTSSNGTEQDLANMLINNVRIEAQSVEQLFSTLSLSYDIPIGLEIGANDNELNEYRIDFKKGTVSDLLTRIVNRLNSSKDEYTWEIRNGVVYVLPSASHRDAFLRELLAAKVDVFSVMENTNCWALVESLVSLPEIRKILDAHGVTYRGRGFTGVYLPQLGKKFTLKASNISVESILNKIITESPTAKFWITKRNRDDQQTFFISFSTRHEDLPVKERVPRFPKTNF